MFSTIFTARQQEYLEGVDIEASPEENADLLALIVFALFSTPLAFLLPLLLYDPRWQINGGAEPSAVMASTRGGVFAWSWNSSLSTSDPTQMTVWMVCLLVYGVGAQLLLLQKAFRERKLLRADRTACIHLVLSWVVSSALTLLCVYLAWHAPYFLFDQEAMEELGEEEPRAAGAAPPA